MNKKQSKKEKSKALELTASQLVVGRYYKMKGQGYPSIRHKLISFNNPVGRCVVLTQGCSTAITVDIKKLIKAS